MKRLFLIAIAFIVLTLPASAHVTLETGMASWGSYYKAVFRVPHGCDRSATTSVSIDIPEGVIGVKPMPKPGWKLAAVSGKYEKTYTNHGKPVSEGVRRVEWSGGRLPDDQFDEFVFLAKLPEDKEIMRLFFPVTQICEKGTIQWNEIAAPGSDPHKLKSPAPSLDLMGPHEGMEHMHH